MVSVATSFDVVCVSVKSLMVGVAPLLDISAPPYINNGRTVLDYPDKVRFVPANCAVRLYSQDRMCWF